MAATNYLVSSKVSSPSGRRTAQAVRYATAEKLQKEADFKPWLQALHMTVVQHSSVGVPELNLYQTFDLVAMSNKNWFCCNTYRLETQ